MMQTAANEKFDLRFYWEYHQPPQMSVTDLGENKSVGGVSLGMHAQLAPSTTVGCDAYLPLSPFLTSHQNGSSVVIGCDLMRNSL